MALLPVIFPAWCGTDTTTVPQRCDPWAAGMSAEALWMAVLAQECFLLGLHWGGRLCGVDWAWLWGSSTSLLLSLFLGMALLSVGSLASPIPVDSESWRSVYSYQ